ncbi:MAG: hypothetical protein M1831_007085 [Alyxoria varia]|nr:MAG: hypothetical protein M1831_007085 [Alyxoria varia]
MSKASDRNGVVTFIESNTNLSVGVTTYTNRTTSVRDLSMSLSVPKKYGWGAVGIGNRMAGSIMFITYPSSVKNQTTLSVRTAEGHNEPHPMNGANCQPKVTSFEKDMMYTGFICYGMGDSQRLRRNGDDSSWIWAVGPQQRILSSSKEAELEEHHSHGTFNLNLAHADSTPLTQEPLPTIANSTSAGVQSQTPLAGYSQLVHAHAILLGGAFLVMFPLGIILLRLRGTRWHWPCQTLATVLCIIGLAIAVTMSKGSGNPDSSNMTQPHQVLGIIAVVLVTLQFSVGWAAHLLYKIKGIQSWVTKTHVAIGSITLLVGMINGVSGFSLAGNGTGAVAYGIVAASLYVLIAIFSYWSRERKRKHLRRPRVISLMNEKGFGSDEGARSAGKPALASRKRDAGMQAGSPGPNRTATELITAGASNNNTAKKPIPSHRHDRIGSNTNNSTSGISKHAHSRSHSGFHTATASSSGGSLLEKILASKNLGTETPISRSEKESRADEVEARRQASVAAENALFKRNELKGLKPLRDRYLSGERRLARENERKRERQRQEREAERVMERRRLWQVERLRRERERGLEKEMQMQRRDGARHPPQLGNPVGTAPPLQKEMGIEQLPPSGGAAPSPKTGPQQRKRAEDLGQSRSLLGDSYSLEKEIDIDHIPAPGRSPPSPAQDNPLQREANPAHPTEEIPPSPLTPLDKEIEKPTPSLTSSSKSIEIELSRSLQGSRTPLHLFSKSSSQKSKDSAPIRKPSQPASTGSTNGSLKSAMKKSPSATSKRSAEARSTTRSATGTMRSTTATKSFKSARSAKSSKSTMTQAGGGDASAKATTGRRKPGQAPGAMSASATPKSSNSLRSAHSQSSATHPAIPPLPSTTPTTPKLPGYSMQPPTPFTPAAPAEQQPPKTPTTAPRPPSINTTKTPRSRSSRFSITKTPRLATPKVGTPSSRWATPRLMGEFPIPKASGATFGKVAEGLGFGVGGGGGDGGGGGGTSTASVKKGGEGDENAGAPGNEDSKADILGGSNPGTHMNVHATEKSQEASAERRRRSSLGAVLSTTKKKMNKGRRASEARVRPSRTEEEMVPPVPKGSFMGPDTNGSVAMELKSRWSD